MCFPTLQQNSSPFGLLPNYIGVLGKKIDAGELEQEYGSGATGSVCFLDACVASKLHLL